MKCLFEIVGTGGTSGPLVQYFPRFSSYIYICPIQDPILSRLNSGTRFRSDKNLKKNFDRFLIRTKNVKIYRLSFILIKTIHFQYILSLKSQVYIKISCVRTGK